MAKKPAVKSTTRMPLRPLLAVLGTVAVLALGYLAIVWLGEQASRAIVHRPRYQVKFDDVQCPSPPGLARAAFLSEVRYLGNPPLEFSSVDPAIPKRLAEAFTKHPWVAQAAPAESQPSWPSPVTLVFRTPTLAVTLPGGSMRVVDAGGVLLPASASSASLPRLLTPQPEPTASAGEKWPNLDVRRAIEMVKDYEAYSLEKQVNGWRITLRNGKVLEVAR